MPAIRRALESAGWQDLYLSQGRLSTDLALIFACCSLFRLAPQTGRDAATKDQPVGDIADFESGILGDLLQACCSAQSGLWELGERVHAGRSRKDGTVPRSVASVLRGIRNPSLRQLCGRVAAAISTLPLHPEASLLRLNLYLPRLVAELQYLRITSMSRTGTGELGAPGVSATL